MKKIIFILLFCLFATNVFCSNKDDGRWWLKLTETEKSYYVGGLVEGYMCGVCKVAAYKEMSLEEMTTLAEQPTGYNTAELQEMLNYFYSNPQYRKLEVSDLLFNIVYPALYNSWDMEKANKEALELLKRRR